MFGLRTPAKKAVCASPGEGCPETAAAGPSTSPIHASNVRRSIGEWEGGKIAPKATLTKSPNQQLPEAPSKTKNRAALSLNETRVVTRRTSTEAYVQSPPIQKVKYASRTAEAKAVAIRAKTLLGQSRNIKADIKTDVTAAIGRLYELVKEGEYTNKEKEPERPAQAEKLYTEEVLKKLLEDHRTALDQHADKMRDLEKALETQARQHADGAPSSSYAEAAASHRVHVPKTPVNGTMHSIIVTSQEETETGEEVLNKIRQAVDAKEGWIKVERVRKAKDRKVILGFGSREERSKARERLEKNGVRLLVEEVRNRDPLLLLKDVLAVNTDEDLIKAYRNQNREVFHGLGQDEDRIAIKYRKRARNPHTCHVVVSVSPAIWGRTLRTGSLHIDLQRIRVEDQSPLVQCTRCLGYGHGKRFCREGVDLCSHCGGPHLNSECAERLAGEAPRCRNCAKAQLDKVQHNAFYLECPVRKKWDRLARSAVAYC